jgi:[ribosomal protein S5]-alanine N-acetyltransferase
MIERETHMVVGDAGFFRPPDENGVVEIGYSVVPDRRGRGYATRSGARAHRLGTAPGWCRRRRGRLRPRNAASIGTLERVGFQRAGESVGELRWTLS